MLIMSPPRHCTWQQCGVWSLNRVNVAVSMSQLEQMEHPLKRDFKKPTQFDARGAKQGKLFKDLF